MAIGRPILGALPAANLAARLIIDNEAGFVTTPGDASGLVDAARKIASDPNAAAMMGRKARAYAERAFNIDTITDRFEAIFEGINEMRVKKWEK